MLSKPRRESPYSKVTIRPVLVDEELRYQFEYRKGEKATHANLDPSEAEATLAQLISRDFRQALLQTPVHDYQVLDGEKVLRRPPTGKPADLAHDRRKYRLLEEGAPVPFLVIGTMLLLPWMLGRWGVRKTLAVGILAWPFRYAILAYGEPKGLVIAALTNGSNVEARGTFDAQTNTLTATKVELDGGNGGGGDEDGGHHGG